MFIKNRNLFLSNIKSFKELFETDALTFVNTLVFIIVENTFFHLLQDYLSLNE